MKVGEAGPTTMVSRAKQITKSKDVKDGDAERVRRDLAGMMGMGGSRYEDEGGKQVERRDLLH